MSTPEELPNLDGVLARARAARPEMAAALDEDQEPELDEDLGWQPVWKRPRKFKSKADKKPMGRRWSGDLRRSGVSRFPTKSGGVSAAGSGWVLLNASLTRPGTLRGARFESQARSSPRVVE
ncbi:hypothetical protein [Streptomyces sp. NPDC017086]|uniref:hypothetical protein n=1 Tax=Streptomyces sp. NPDC017086 TaxID=3364976 RepID=UPI00379F8457